MQNFSTKKCDETIIYSSFSPPPQIKVGFSTKGRTKQSFKSECDINQIMARFLKSGVLDFVQKNEPRYADVSGLDYQQAMLRIASAKTMFNELPAQVRSFFDNEPALFLDFVQNPKNHAECVEMGLRRPTEGPAVDGGPSPAPSEEKAPVGALRNRDGTYREETRAEKRAAATSGDVPPQGARAAVAGSKDQ